MAACLEPTRNHEARSNLIIEIESVQTKLGFTAYDVLRLPMYKTQAEHAINHANLVVELSLPACTCVGKGIALVGKSSAIMISMECSKIAAVNTAWGSISTPLLRRAYDALIDTPPPLKGFYTITRDYPSFLGAGDIRSANFPAVLPNPGYALDHPFSVYFNGVEYCPETYFAKCPRSSRLYHRHQEYSFWFAVAYSIDDTELTWANHKVEVETYMISTMTRQAEPRFSAYWSLFGYQLNKYPLSGDLTSQVEPDGTIHRVVVPGSPYRPEIVSPELWQMVADALKIELIIIMAHIPVARVGRRAYKTVVSRGDHRNPQVFLFLEEDGEYRCVVPFVDRPAEWRFTGHIPPHHNTPTRRPRAVALNTARVAALRESNLRRCPFIETDDWGIPTHLDQPAGGPPIVPVAIPAIFPGFPVGIHVAPFKPLNPLSPDANPTEWPAGRAAGTLRHLNPSSGRWI
ncbi:hypothetical protein VTL71DRAFT_6895 [Oculimacula yallundae]|uniref:Uncharacterized protein n=1 Tax=Oculimacula yallundae TaxID=86028 RepID=A0ABR4BV76_9HELO